MRVLVTGATGLVGKRVCQKLIADGHSVVITTRSREGLDSRITFPCEVIEWDTRSDFPADRLKDTDAVIHLAGESIAAGLWTKKQKQRIFDSRVLSTATLSRAMAELGDAAPKSFLCASAIGYYSWQSDKELTEQSDLGYGFLADVCSAWEQACHAGTLDRTRVVNLRIGVVLSRDGGMLEKIEPVFANYAGGRLGNGKQMMSFIHIDDLVNAIVFCLNRNDISGPVNLTAPNPVDNAGFTHSMANAMGVIAPFPVPALALRALLGEMSQLMLGNQKVIPAVLQKHGFHFQHPDIDSAFAALFPAEHRHCQRFYAAQWVPTPVDKVFPFFADEKNLEEITPEILGFRVLDKSTKSVREGTIINYRLKIHGFPTRWQTLIKNWQPNEKFTDTQLKGPYRKWHHTHFFKDSADGALLEDEIYYRVPFGMAGRLAAGWFVRRDVRNIFRYRQQVISEKFGDVRLS